MIFISHPLFSRAKLVEHLRVRLHQANQKLCLEQSERTEVRSSLRETIQLVRTTVRGGQQQRLRMP